MDEKNKKQVISMKTVVLINDSKTSDVYVDINYALPVSAVKISISSYLGYANNDTKPFSYLKCNLPQMDNPLVVSYTSQLGDFESIYYKFSQPIELNGQYRFTLEDLSNQPRVLNANSYLVLHLQLISYI